jgi:HlyD family secretion protein
MKGLPCSGRTLALLAVIVPLLGALHLRGLRSGPAGAGRRDRRERGIASYHAGVVRHRHGGGSLHLQIGPTFAGRVKRLDVHVGDQVRAGQVLGEMEPVDLDDRVRSQESAFKRAEGGFARGRSPASLRANPGAPLRAIVAVRSVSEEIVTTKRQELQIADAALSAAGKMLIGHAPTVKDWSRSGAICA